jgi:ribonuclease-3
MLRWWSARRRTESLPEASREDQWRCLGEKLGLPAIDEDLLRQAFAHPSYVREHRLPPHSSNQRLEFLGDAVLDLIIAEHLYLQFPEEPEGELTRRKAALVRKSTLAEISRQLGLGERLLLGHGEEETGGRRKASLLADAVEALIGAVYLATGWETTRRFVLDHFADLLAQDVSGPAQDAKTLLQETIQSRTKCLPSYELVQISGPPHERCFEVRVCFQDQLLGEGSGTGKRAAEQAAAKQALERQQEWLGLLEAREDAAD